MLISQKCLYALRAVFELSLKESSEPVKINKIADAQNIPPRFLEIILNQLKHAGYVDSRRGKSGGYILARDPKELTVGEIIEALQGPIERADKGDTTAQSGPRRGDYAFTHMWDSIKGALISIYSNTSFSDLIEMERGRIKSFVINYSI